MNKSRLTSNDLVPMYQDLARNVVILAIEDWKRLISADKHTMRHNFSNISFIEIYNFLKYDRDGIVALSGMNGEAIISNLVKLYEECKQLRSEGKPLPFKVRKRRKKNETSK